MVATGRAQEALTISMLPLESVSCRRQPPEPMVPFRESPPMLPDAVTGKSDVMRPNDVWAERL